MEIHIRNMVCGRCIKVVTGIFQELEVPLQSVQLGIVVTTNDLSAAQTDRIKDRLKAEGFEWLDDQKVRLVERIKREIVQLVHYGELDEMNSNLSAYLSGRLHKEYPLLSHTFSSIENTTIEQYFILQKIEKVKEWLVYGEYTLSEIAFRLGYSSTAHLSNQFKKITGFSPSQFKQLKDHHRKPLDEV